MAIGSVKHKNKKQLILSYFWTAVGAFLAALSIKIFLFPNDLIDGGIIGISMILTRLTIKPLFPRLLYYLDPSIYLSFL